MYVCLIYRIQILLLLLGRIHYRRPEETCKGIAYPFLTEITQLFVCIAGGASTSSSSSDSSTDSSSSNIDHIFDQKWDLFNSRIGGQTICPLQNTTVLKRYVINLIYLYLVYPIPHIPIPM